MGARPGPAGLAAGALVSTRRLTMAGAVVEFLKRQFVSRDGREHRLVHGVFGIFGHGNVTGLGQALDEHGGRELPYLQPKNEQAMVHTAIAFAKARRRLGTFACTTSVGPGATNMVTGAATATINRLPVLLLPGDMFANRLPAPVLQQLESPAQPGHERQRLLPPRLAVLGPHQPAGAAAGRAARGDARPRRSRGDGRGHPRPPAGRAGGGVRLPGALLRQARVRGGPASPATPQAVAAAAALLRAAQRPLIVAGGGVHYSEAEAALLAFAEATGIPVAVTQAGKGTLPDAHPRCLGALGVTGTLAANRLAADADLVLVLGTRLSDFTTASKTQFQHDRVRFVSVNVNAADAAKHGALPLVADARAALADLVRRAGRAPRGARLRPGHRRGPRGVGGRARADPAPGAARGKPPAPGGGHPRS